MLMSSARERSTSHLRPPSSREGRAGTLTSNSMCRVSIRAIAMQLQSSKTCKVSRGPGKTSHSTVPNAKPLATATKVASSYKILTKLTSAKTVMLMSRSGIGCAHVTTHGTYVRHIGPIVVSVTVYIGKVMSLHRCTCLVVECAVDTNSVLSGRGCIEFPLECATTLFVSHETGRVVHCLQSTCLNCEDYMCSPITEYLALN